MSKYLPFLLFVLCVNVSQAQTDSSARPKPIVASAPENRAWTVTITPAHPTPKSQESAPVPSGQFPPSGALLREENLRSGDMRKETKVFTGGSLTRYAKGEYLLYLDSRSNEIRVDLNDSESFAGGLTHSRFSELSWVKPEMLIKQEDYKGIKCDVYQRSWPITDDDRSIDGEDNSVAASALPSRGTITAYINQNTRLPVALEDPLSIRSYIFAPTQTTLALPQAFVEALKMTNDRLQYRERFYGADQ